MIRRPIGVGDREIKIRSIAIESSSKSVRFYEEILKGEKRSIPSSEDPPWCRPPERRQRRTRGLQEEKILL